MIFRWNPDCDSQPGVPIPSLLACIAGDGGAAWLVPEQPPGRGQPSGAGQRCGMGGAAAFIPPATYPYSRPAASSLLPFPPADLGGEREGKRAALGTDRPARREWPARPFPVLRGFSRELLLSMWEQEADPLTPSAAPGVNRNVPKSGIKTSVAVTL